MRTLQQSILLCAALLLAFTTDTSAAAEDTVSVEFRVLLWPRQFSPDYTGTIEAYSVQSESAEDEANVRPISNTPPLYFFASGTTPTQLQLKDGSFSGWSRYHGIPQLRFYASIPPPDASLHPVAASVNLPAGVRRLLLIFFPLSPTSYRVIPIPYPFDNLQADEAVVMNLSPSIVRCTLGGEAFELSPGESATRKPQIIDGYLEAIVIARRTDENRWRREILRKYPRYPNKHALFIIFPRGAGSNGLDLLRLGVDMQ